MRTSAATLELDFTEPSITAAKAVAAAIARNGSVQRDTLLWVMEQAYGYSSADGRWSLRDAYDMLELAEVLYLANADLPADPAACLSALTQLVGNLPTHTVRSEEQIELQQFSTPAPIAYLAALAARIAPTDLVLEPSAATGLLAVFAQRAGANLVLNEIDQARAEMLAAAFPGVPVTRHDGELIHDLLAPTIRPTAVLINPPFSRSIGRHADPLAAFRHLRAALVRLAAGGRCAAILPDRVDTSSRAWAKATEGCALTLHLELPANAYAKHGTSQPVKIMVLEKGVGDHAGLLRCETLADALSAIVAHTARATKPASVARSTTALLIRPSGRSSLLGGLASKPRLAAPAGTTAQSLAAIAIDYTVFAEPAPTGESVGVYLPYRPSRIAIPCASAHPTALVESIAMGSITAPRPTYIPTLPHAVVDAKTLSDAQLETLIYAGDAFERDIPGLFKPVEEGLSIAPSEDGRPYRTGFFLGDGTGAGKGRQVAAIILDQWLRGRRKHIWVSKTETLLEDARRDWTAVGGLALDIQHLNQWKLGTPIGAAEGVLFLTYATLRSNRGDKGTRLQQILEWVGGQMLLGLGIFGTAIFFGDGVITPAISVLSAVEGMEVAAPGLERFVVPVTLVVLTLLFMVQKHGTGGIGKFFGPITAVWFLVLAVLGLIHIVDNPSILWAMSPHHALIFIYEHPKMAFVALGAVVLCATGAEALYADMGHFGKKPIRLAWFLLAMPALVLNYFGQGAMLLKHPENASNPFFEMAPHWALYPLVILATFATVIASQALISAAFSVTKQVIQLGYLPRLRIMHTSVESTGQIYIPFVNWTLYGCIVMAVVFFGSSGKLAAAYGITVTIDMLITTVMTFFVIRFAWKLALPLCIAATTFFFVIDVLFFSANVIKVIDGGWFPLLIGGIMFMLMMTWKQGRALLSERLRSDSIDLEPFLDAVFSSPPTRVQGTAVFLNADAGTTPNALLHNLKHNKVLHEQNLFVTVKAHEVPWIGLD